MNMGIAIVAKAPLPGLAKTRLARDVGLDAAAALAARLLQHAVSEAVATGLPVTLYGTPSDHPLLQVLAKQHEVGLSPQVEGDLGCRLSAIVEQALRTHQGVLVMGSDCPALSAERIRNAALALATHDAAIYPALDGGYTLIGLKQLPTGFFDDMPWSTEEVLSKTLQRLQCASARVWQGETLADIDQYGDLAHLPRDWQRPHKLAGQAHD